MTLSKMPPGLVQFPVADTSDAIDVNDGIERMMGNRELYARALARFRRHYKDEIAPVRDALLSGDDALAHRLVIALMGAAGLIGAQRLYQRACELDDAMSNDDSEQLAILADLGRDFKQVLDSIDVMLEGSPL